MIAGTAGARPSTRVISRARAERSPPSMRSTSRPGSIDSSGRARTYGGQAARPSGALPLTRSGAGTRMRRVAHAGELSVSALARSPWVVAGLLLLAIGLGDLAVGRM